MKQGEKVWAIVFGFPTEVEVTSPGEYMTSVKVTTTDKLLVIPNFDMFETYEECDRILEVRKHMNGFCIIDSKTFDELERLGMLDKRIHAMKQGNSNYHKFFIQPWHIWKCYEEVLTSWDDDIIKRVLRTKEDAGYTPEEQRILDYKKIMHNCEERIRQLEWDIRHKSKEK